MKHRQTMTDSLLNRPALRAHVPEPPPPSQPEVPPTIPPPGAPDHEIDLPPREDPEEIDDPDTPEQDEPPVRGRGNHMACSLQDTVGSITLH